MHNLSRMKPVLCAALLCAVLVAFCVAFLDRPVERFVVTQVLRYKDRRLFFQAMAAPSLLPIPLACAFLLFHALRHGLGLPAGRFSRLYLSLGIATAVATMAKDQLKWIIGRPWPGTWTRFGIYKLHPFIANVYFGSFPSGHTTYIAAPMFVLWWRLPRYRPLWLAIIFSVMIGLVLSGYHWVGDVIAGGFLGLAAAAGTLAAERKPPVAACSTLRNRRSL